MFGQAATARRKRQQYILSCMVTAANTHHRVEVASPPTPGTIITGQVVQKTHGRLRPDQTTHFHKEGYLKFDQPVLSPAKFAGLQSRFEGLLSAWPSGRRPEDMDVPHLRDPGLFEWLFDDAILDLVEPILGPDIALFSSHFLCKPAGTGKRVPWHQDSYYWRHLLDPMEVVTVWLAIDASGDENGAMRIVPRTHLSGDADYEEADTAINTFPKEIARRNRNEATAVTLDLEPNHCSLHSAALYHGSEANRSTLRRCGYTMRFISTHTKFNQEHAYYHQIYLARGRDRAGNTYGDPSVARPDLIAAREGRVRRGH